MISKCANPECSERFMRLQNGKLFRWDGANGRPSFADVASGTWKVRKIEFFWLCGECARKMTLVFTTGNAVTTRALADFDLAAREGARALAWRDTGPAVHSSEPATSRRTYVFRRATG